MNIDRIIWATWWIGTIIIACSWFKIVPNTVGWVGFGLACAASLVSVILNKYWRIPPKTEDEVLEDKEELDTPKEN